MVRWAMSLRKITFENDIFGVHMLVFIPELLYSALKDCILRKLHVSVFQFTKISVYFRKRFHVIVWKISSNSYLLKILTTTNFGQQVSPLGELFSQVTLTTEINVMLPKQKYILNASFFRSNMVYKFACGRCNATYYGETDRRFIVRVVKHSSISPLTNKRSKSKNQKPLKAICWSATNQFLLTILKCLLLATLSSI